MSIETPPNIHWTHASMEDFILSVVLDVVAEIESHMEEHSVTRGELADCAKVTPSAVSQFLNDPPLNPRLSTIVRYARALGLKACVVLYDDGDPQNEKGPVFSGVFHKSWRAHGKPRDLFPFEGQP